MASLSNINGLFDVHSTGAILFSTSHGTSGQILRSNGNAAPTWVAASTVIGGPYLPLTGGTLTGATATATGISFTVGGNLFVTGTSTLTGALSGSTGTFSGSVTGTVARFDTLNNNANSANIIYRSGTVTIVGNNANALVVEDGGNVGIGEPTPNYKLNIASATNTDGIYLSGTGTSMTNGEYRQLQFGYSDTDTSYGSTIRFVVPDATTHGGQMEFYTDETSVGTLTRAMTIDNSQNVGIGTDSPTYKLQVAGTTLISGGLKVIGPGSYNTFQSGNDYTLGLNDYNSVSQWWLKAYTTGDFALHENAVGDKFTIKAGGNVGINNTNPGHTLSVGGTAKISSGLLVGSYTFITNFTTPYFTNLTANLNVDLNLGNTTFWGHLEVTITGTYSNQNTPGKLTKIYAIGLNPNGSIYTNVSRVSDAMGPVVTQINLGEVRWDSTTSTYRIRIAHIASTGNGYYVEVKGFAYGGDDTLPDLGISALYTQSTTGLLAQIPSFKTEMATFSAATGSTSGIISANSGYITSFSNSATHASSNSALFVPVANGIKITQAGLIQVTLTQDFISTSSASYASVAIYKNSTPMFYSLRTNSNSQWDMLQSTGTMIVAANDVIGFYYQAGDFTSMDTGGWSQYSFIWTSL